MRILHLSRPAETLRAFLIPTFEAQKRLGHEVLICADDSPEAAQLRRQGYTVFTHRMKRSMSPWGALREAMRVRPMLVEQRIDVVICHTSLGAVVGRLAAWMARTPRVVYFVHGLACGPAQGPLSWWVRFLAEKLLAPITDAIVVMNDYDERLARATPLARTRDGVYRIRGMGVDLKRFAPIASPEIRERIGRELGIRPDQKIVLCTARLIPEKGVAEFVEAARHIARTRDDACFLLAGRGPLYHRLRGRVERAGLSDRIRVLGWRNDIRDLTMCADIFVLPSYFMEGLPVSVLEAMASGKPVVSTHHKGCEDAVVNGETGFLVPSRQVQPLAKGIAQLLEDEALRARMGQAGRRRVEARFELGSCTDEIVDVLTRAMGPVPVDVRRPDSLSASAG